MGKTAKPKAVRLLDGSYEKHDQREQEPDGFYPTPPEPTRALLHYEREYLRRFRTIWEPAAGDGAMSEIIRAGGFAVYKSDVVDRGCNAEIKDFFAYGRGDCVPPAIITNPPYHLTNFRDSGGAWIWHALDGLSIEYMALLLPWPWPAAAKSAALWEAHEPARVYLMRWKIDFSGEGQPPMNNGWFVWDRRPRLQPRCQLLMMDRVDDRQGIML